MRLIYENVNVFSNKLSNNDKVDKAREIHDDLEVDIVAYSKHRICVTEGMSTGLINFLRGVRGHSSQWWHTMSTRYRTGAGRRDKPITLWVPDGAARP